MGDGQPGEVVAGVYVRISKARDGTTLGVERQQPPCEAFCQRHGWRVHRVYVDNNVSAWADDPREVRRDEFENLLADVRNGTINAFVSWQPDRLLRLVDDASAIIYLAKRYGTIIANVGGTIDLMTAAGRKKLYDLASSAQYESELRSERLRLKHDELGRAGKWSGGGSRPFGYDIDGIELQRGGKTRKIECRLVLNAPEADEIREAVDKIVTRGATPSRIKTDWNRRGVTRPGGSAWSILEVDKLLRNPRIAGYRRWKGEVYPADWEPIIDLATFERLQLVLDSRPRSAQRGRGPMPRVYLLSGGLLYCDDCKHRLLGAPNWRHRRSYRCPPEDGGCGRVHREADPIEDFVRDEVLHAFDNPALGPKLRARLTTRINSTETSKRLRVLLNERETCRAKLGQLVDDYADDLIDRDQLARGQRRVKERLASIEAELTRATPITLPVDLPTGFDVLRSAWDVWKIEERRAVVEFALKPIAFKPLGKIRFDGARHLKLDWRV